MEGRVQLATDSFQRIPRRFGQRPGSASNHLMTPLSLFGMAAVVAMLLCYALDERSHWFGLGFAVACALGSVYGFLQGAWPFGFVEAVWSLVALRRWWLRFRDAADVSASPVRRLG